MRPALPDALRALAARGWPLMAGGAIDPAPGAAPGAPAAPAPLGADPAPAAPPVDDRAPSGSGGDSATSPAAPPAAAPAAAPAPAPAPLPGYAALQGQMAQLQALDAALREQAAQDANLQRYGDQLPEGLRTEIAQRQAAGPIAAERLAVAREGLALQLQRAQLEAPARAVVEHQQHQAAAAALGDRYDQPELQRFLAQYQQPEAMATATQQYVALKRGQQNAVRAADGTDSMGASGSPPAENRLALSSEELFTRALRGQR